MFAIARATTYAVLVVGLLLIYARAHAPAAAGAALIAGVVIGASGAALALWSAAVFAVAGHGTPAPFDPPRRLVTSGPYRHVRNPIYIGAGFALAGAALAYRSWSLLGAAAVFFLAAHFFVVAFEEPTLRRSFGRDYDVYCGRVRRWRPRV